MIRLKRGADSVVQNAKDGKQKLLHIFDNFVIGKVDENFNTKIFQISL